MINFKGLSVLINLNTLIIVKFESLNKSAIENTRIRKSTLFQLSRKYVFYDKKNPKLKLLIINSIK